MSSKRRVQVVRRKLHKRFDLAPSQERAQGISPAVTHAHDVREGATRFNIMLMQAQSMHVCQAPVVLAHNGAPARFKLLETLQLLQTDGCVQVVHPVAQTGRNHTVAAAIVLPPLPRIVVDAEVMLQPDTIG